jgi:proteasome assembly chaperone (PAC2) family protein
VTLSERWEKMNELIELWERPPLGKYMIAGWHQWADGGDLSSGLPRYLIEWSQARKIGQIKPDGYYLFQIPGMHHLLRPVVKLHEGHRESLGERRNEFFYTDDEERGFLIFLGLEPHRNVDRYAKAFLDVVEELGVKRVALLGGVHGPMPYDKDRQISCTYSLPTMKEELARYAVRFSNYEGGVTIGTYLVHRAEAREIEAVSFNAMVPSYAFSRSSVQVQRMSMGEDHKAWYDLMSRLKFMFDLDLDLSDLQRRSEELISEWDSKIDELEKRMPRLGVREYMEKVNRDFTEVPFVPLSDVWEEELGSLLE